MADTIKFSQLGEISRAQMSGSDYAVGYKTNGDNKKWTFENQADFLLNDSEAGQEFQETFVKVQNTEPTDENNKIWIEETPENEVEVPTYDEFKDLSNLVSGVNEAVFNKLSATADQVSTYIPFTFSTFAGKRYIIKNESSAGGMLARIRQTRDGENGTYITNGTQAGQTDVYEASEDADYIAVMFGPTTTNPAFSIIQEGDVPSKVEEISDDVEDLKSASATLVSSYAQSIAANTDLNTIITYGNYRIESVSIASTLSNLPNGFTNAGRLFVFQSQQTYRLIQVLFNSAYNDNNIWIRYYNGSEWDSWTKIATEHDLTNAINNLESYIFNKFYLTFSSNLNEMVFEKVFSQTSGLYIKIPGTWWFRGGDRYPDSITYSSISNLQKVSSPSGVSDCIYIPHNQALVYNTTTQLLEIVQNTDVKQPNYVPLFLVTIENGKSHYATWYDGVFAGLGKYVYDAYQDLYSGGNNALFVENVTALHFESSGNDLYFKADSSRWAFRGVAYRNVSYSDILTEVGSYAVTSPNGVQNCIKIPSGFGLYLNKYNKKISVVNYNEAAFHGHLPIIIPGFDSLTGENIAVPGGGIGYYLFEQWKNGNDISESIQFRIGTLNTDTGLMRGTSYGLYNKRITSDYILVGSGTALNIKSDALNYMVFYYGLDKTYSNHSGGWLNNNDRTIINSDCFVRIVMRYKDDSDISSISDLKDSLVVENKNLAPSTVEEAEKEKIPYHFETQVKSAIDKIRTNMNDCGQNGDTFVFITDLHWDAYTTEDYRNRHLSPELVKAIAKDTSVQKIIFGGDYFTGNDDPEIEMNHLSEIFDSFSFNGCRQFPIMGNHDWNTYNTPTGQWNDAACYAQIIKRCESYVKMGDELCYYYDNEACNVRYIILNSKFESSTMSSAQVAWFENVLGTSPSGYRIIVMMHIWYGSHNWDENPPQLYLTAQGETIANICDTFNANNNDRKVVVCIGGHAHLDAVYSTNGGIPIVLTDCDAYASTYSSDNAPNTIGEQCFDIMTIDFANNILKCVRVGRGADRVVNL